MPTVTLHVFRGDATGGAERTYAVPVTEGMVVLDAIHHIQAHLDGDLACRWNCKAAKCGSCSAEIDGLPRLLCKTRVDEYPGVIHVGPLRTFPLIKDLVTDVSWNYQVNRRIAPLTTDEEDTPEHPWIMRQRDVERLYEYRKCIECFLCQDVCHVLRSHRQFDQFFGPRYFVRLAYYAFHPKDRRARASFARRPAGIERCNITKCCTEVCPEHIKITDNAIIPLKERLADTTFDPLRWAWRKVTGRRPNPAEASMPDDAGPRR